MTITDYARAVAAAAPPLTNDQRDRIASIVRNIAARPTEKGGRG